MPDFIVIDEVNNKVNQSESNTVTHVLASNTAILNAVNSMNSRVTAMYNTVNTLKTFTNQSGTAVTVYNVSTMVNSFYEDRKMGVAAKFVAPKTGFYYLTAKYTTTNTSCTTSAIQLGTFYE